MTVEKTNPGDPSEVAAIVDQAADLMEKGHCRGTWARDEQGNAANQFGPRAVSFCVAGAIGRATKDRFGFPSSEYSTACTLGLQAVHAELEHRGVSYGGTLGGWQDSRDVTVDAILNVVRAAADRLRQEADKSA